MVNNQEELLLAKIAELEKLHIVHIREIAIEEALEKVRARTMAMQQSNELAETALQLFQQLQDLGFSFWRTGFYIWKKEEGLVQGWTSNGELTGILQPILFPWKEDEGHNAIYESSLNGESVWEQYLDGEALKKHYEWMLSSSTNATSFSQLKDAGVSLPEKQYKYASIFKQGYLMVIATEPQPQMNDLLTRFARVFEQCYTRFIDLQKAEAQAREAQIEAALERVRSRTMAMHQSEELLEVITVVSEQLQHLNFRFANVSFAINNQEFDHTFWLATPGQSTPFKIHVPYIDNPALNRVKHAQNHKIDFFADVLTPEENHEWLVHIINNSIIKDASAETKKYLLSRGGFARSMALTNHISFTIGNFASVPYTEEENAIFKRFANVFEQSFTRFLDLQKAEAQAREAQIETALEKVRSRSMGMQKSKELQDVIQVIFHQFEQLNFKINAASFNLLFNESDDLSAWIASSFQTYPTLIHIPYSDNEVQKSLKEAKKNTLDFYTRNVSYDEKNKFWEHFFKYVPIPTERQKYLLSCPGYAGSIVLMSHFALNIVNYDGIPYSEEENAIIKRFAKVFEQSYIRFLDLQKAEEQTREAQIEASLERVRSKTMAMHNSQDVGETVVTLFDELVKLGLDELERCGIGIMHEPYIMEAWTASKTNESKAELVIGHIDMKIHPLLQGTYEVWKQKKEVFQYILEADDKINYFNIVNNQPNYNAKRDIATLSNRVILTTFYFNEGCLYAFSVKELSAETAKIFTRFAAVFGQTYRRYLDLQKAEAQAREAQIETALEKVRSRSLAMQKGIEIVEVLATVKNKLIELHVNFDIVNITIFSEDNKDTKVWTLTKNDIKYDDFSVPYVNSSFANDLWVARSNHLSIFSKCFSGAEKEAFLHYLFEQTEFRKVKPERKEYIKSCQYYTISIGMGDRIGIQLVSLTRNAFTDEENAILIKFTKVFEQAYIRFLDIQNAEIQALEALKRASVDRVRAEIASMRTSSDLERITPIIWNELTTLGVPFIRCGVFIMDEENQQIQTMLSTAEGKAIASFQLPYENSEPLKDLLPHWRKMEIYQESWDEKTFVESTKILLQRGAISSPETYATEHPPTNLHLHFLPFLQGMLYVGNEAPLNKDEMQLVQYLADAFSIAYARYEDFNKLESAKEQIEITLKDLKATQSLLIQSEKMASLGELTAGIAHEIQNPLNFVNNFSEVSTELVDEMNEEIQKGNFEDAQQIAADLKENLSKINHHGKRAGDIVRGMLQHSRSNSGQKEPTDINALADEYLRLAYHGLRAKDKSFNATMHTDFDTSIGMIQIIPQDIGRVILNLITNAFYVVDEKNKIGMENYEPTVSVSTKKIDGKILISVKDNGNGIPQKVLDKIFQPFFTTKPTGQGTGLGLSLSYDIVKAHGGEIKVNTKVNEGLTSKDSGTEFTIQLPI